MAEGEQTKVCPLCAETIKAAAKVCPFCCSKQGRYVLWRQELLIAGSAAVLTILASMAIAFVAPDEKGVGGRSFAGHQNDLVILNSSLERPGTKPDIWMAGTITNRGEYPWRVHAFEVRFLDEHNNLLDVSHPTIRDSFVVQSRQEHGFRVELGRLAFTNNDIVRQVRVQMATDGDRRMKSD
jgi:hypothetical protein